MHYAYLVLSLPTLVIELLTWIYIQNLVYIQSKYKNYIVTLGNAKKAFRKHNTLMFAASVYNYKFTEYKDM